MVVSCTLFLRCRGGESVRLMSSFHSMPQSSNASVNSAMEDAHAIVLDLDENAEDTNAFFAVYDGHGGDWWLFDIFENAHSHFTSSGGTVAKFAGQNVHKRLKSEERYQEKDYETALKKAFLGTDEDLLASEAIAFFCSYYIVND
jgi:serine/threonine protein phosphatase PrpC